jgi:hypothetical protein
MCSTYRIVTAISRFTSVTCKHIGQNLQSFTDKDETQVGEHESLDELEVQ